MGASSALRSSRDAIQESSAQLYARSQTTDAVFGGSSQANAKGSAFSSARAPLCGEIRNLYSEPAETSGMNPSQIPEDARGRSRRRPPCQPLNPPTPATRPASGAQTA